MEDLPFIADLMRSQWASPRQLAEDRAPLLARIVRHAATQTDFYRDRLKPLFASDENVPPNLSRWPEVPIVRRTDVAERWREMIARNVPAGSGAASENVSSGSTGRPLHHLRSALADLVSACQVERVYLTQNVDLYGSLAFITIDRSNRYSYPEGAAYDGWNRTVRGAKMFVLEISTSAAEQAEWLARVKPDHVMTYPMTLREIAEFIAVSGRPPLSFSTFISTGETLDEETRHIVANAFGCRIIDLYAAREIGPIAFQCPDAAGYHQCCESVLCELVDDAGRPVQPGEFGRVIVTSLYNFAMPFVRYDIGDYAQASPSPCRCGRTLPYFTAIGGRARNFFIMPDGSRRRLRGGVFRELENLLDYSQAQFVQTRTDELILRYVPLAKSREPVLDLIVELLRTEFHRELNVRLETVEKIERSPGFKVEQLISLVAGKPGDADATATAGHRH